MQTTTERSCEECEAKLLDGAQFCVACGGSVAAPATCPKCAASLPASAKFCSSCGGKVVGARPKIEASAPPVVAAAAKTEAPAPAPIAVTPPPPRPKPASTIGSNVLLFVAFLLALVVVIYEMNKDAEKTVSPFEAAPAPNLQPPGGAAAPAPGPAGSDGGPINGSVKIAAALGAPPSGTMFVILRNQGMPNKGPPLAVKRVESPSFPASFTVSADDIMMKGLPFAGPFDIYVRLDADGDPMTKAPGDLTNEKPKSGVLAGAKDVEIELDQRL